MDDKSRLLVRDAGVSFVGAVGSLRRFALRDRLWTSHLEYIHRLLEHGSTAHWLRAPLLNSSGRATTGKEPPQRTGAPLLK